MGAFDSLLLPTDFSDGSRQAAKYASELAGSFGAKIHAIHVLEPLVLPPVLGEALPSSFHAQRESAAQQQFHDWLASVLGKDMTASLTIKHGNPAEEIMQYALEHEIDLIVMGTHGRTGLTHALAGSVAERVVRDADCPVLTVRGSRHHAGG